MLYKILEIFDRIVQLVLPKDANAVCYVSSPDYTDNAFYMYRHILQNRSNLCHVWLVADISIADRIRKEFDLLSNPDQYNSLLVFKKHSLSGYFRHLRCRNVFHTHGAYSYSRAEAGRNVVNLWHGMPIKCIGRLNLVSPNPRPTFGTLHIATSHLFKYIIAAAFNAPPEKVLVSGLPRCDFLKSGPHKEAARSALLKRLGICGDRKIVLWMPTYRTEDAGSSAGTAAGFRSFLNDMKPETLQKIDGLASVNNCTVVVKLHPYDGLNRVDPPRGLKSIRFINSLEWAKSGAQLYDFIAITDGLISDVSSVLIDYLVTAKPAAILAFDERMYSRDLTIPVDLLRKSGCFHFLGDDVSLQNYFQKVAAVESCGESEDAAMRDLFYDSRLADSCGSILQEIGL